MQVEGQGNFKRHVSLQSTNDGVDKNQRSSRPIRSDHLQTVEVEKVQANRSPTSEDSRIMIVTLERVLLSIVQALSTCRVFAMN